MSQMTSDQEVCWKRVEHYNLDALGASFPFSAKLARENGWTAEFTSRVIFEYKRFVFLATVCGHPVSPSEAVDQAWHMHLLYTEDYWTVFCPKFLGRPLHHSPSKGGKDESDKFEDWYSRTLQSYRDIFGQEPPQDIWPLKPSLEPFRRVNLARNWVIPKPRGVLVKGAGLFTLVPLLAGCTPNISPLDYTGPEFLSFYFWLQTVFFIVAGAVRFFMRSATPAHEEAELSVYEVALVNGGEVLTVNTAVTGLVSQGLLTVDRKSGTVTAQVADQGDDLQRAILNRSHTKAGLKMPDVRVVAAPYVQHIRAKVEALGLILPESRARWIAAVATIVSLSPTLLGLAKVQVGLSREKPVAFLIIMMVVFGLVSLVIFCRRPLRTRSGDSVIKAMKRSGSPRGSSLLDSEALMMGVALFGLSSLAPTPLRDLQQGLRPPAGSSSCGGSSSGCGGDGGGGGGCGGGGCGGCGGG